MKHSPLVGFVVAVVLVVTGASAQQDPTRQLLARTGEYLQQFVTRFSNVVAEERYLQRTTSPRRTRQLTSDYLLVVYPGATEWFPFRDVLTVDGTPVPAAERDQLTRLFLDAPANAGRRARELGEAGSRYNLAKIGTVNTPLQALSFLQFRYQDRFRFARGSLERELGPGIRVLRYEEILRPTILRSGAANNDLPARGRVWIVEDSGAIVKTELRLGAGRFPTEIVTTFAFDSELEVYVPVEMRESHPDGSGELRGVATYGRFRRFQVRTEVALPD